MTAARRLLPFLALAAAPLDYPPPPSESVEAQVRWALERLAEPAEAASREAGSRWLRGLGAEAVPALARAAVSPAPWRVRVGALDLLREVGGRLPDDAFANLVVDGNRAVRVATLRLAERFEAGLAGALDDPFHDVRREALRAIARSARRGHRPEAFGLVPAVEARLADPDESVRSEAAGTLLALARVLPETSPADRLFDPSDPERCWEAMRRLSREGSVPPSLAARLAALARDATLSIERRRVVAALAVLGGSPDRELFRLAIHGFLVGRESWIADLCLRAVRSAGLEGLGLLAEEAADAVVEPSRFGLAVELLAAADPGKAGDRLFRLLDRLPESDEPRRPLVYRNLPVAAGPDAVRDLAKRSLDESSPTVRAAAAEALARWSAPDLDPVLLRHFEDREGVVRRAAILAAAREARERAAAEVAGCLLRERDAALRAELAEVLSRWIRADVLRDALLAALASGEDRVRAAAIAGLSRFRADARAVEGLREAFRREGLPVSRGGPADLGPARRRRAMAVAAAAQVGGPEAVRFLAEAARELRRSPDEEETAILALTRLAERPEGEAVLQDLLSGDAARAVKFEAAMALARRGRAEAAGFVERAFPGLDPAARRRALDALATTSGAIEFLLAVASDASENVSVRERAVEILARFVEREAVRSLLAALARGESARGVRLVAIRSLGEGSGAKVEEILRAVLSALPWEDDPAEAREARREAVFALSRVAGGRAAADLAGFALERPLSTWRESIAEPEPRRRADLSRAYGPEAEAFGRLAEMGEAGRRAVSSAIAAAQAAGTLYLLDPGFLALAGERLCAIDPPLGLELLAVATRTARAGERLAARLRLADAAAAHGEAALAAEVLAQAHHSVEEGEVGTEEALLLLGDPAPYEEFFPLQRLAVEAELASGLAAFERGDAEAGGAALDRALERAGRDPGALRRVALWSMQRPALLEWALRIARRAVEAAPGDRRAREALGWALLRAGDPGGSLEAFEAGLSLPDYGARGDGPALFGAAAARLALGEEAKAIDALREAFRRDPGLREAAERSPFFEALRSRLPELELGP